VLQDFLEEELKVFMAVIPKTRKWQEVNSESEHEDESELELSEEDSCDEEEELKDVLLEFGNLCVEKAFDLLKQNMHKRWEPLKQAGQLIPVTAGLSELCESLQQVVLTTPSISVLTDFIQQTFH